MSLRNGQIQQIEYSIDISRSISMMAKIATQPQWKTLEKENEEIPIIIRWVAELSDVNLNNPIGKFVSAQTYYIKVEDADSLITEVATIFFDSQKNAQKLFISESKKRNFKLPAWDLHQLPDEFMMDLLTELRVELPKNPAS